MATILIDCDPGVDDFLAIFMVLNHLSKSTTNILPVITTVGGNATIEDTTTNACSLLNFYKQHAMSHLATDNIAIGVGATHPIEGKFKYAMTRPKQIPPKKTNPPSKRNIIQN